MLLATMKMLEQEFPLHSACKHHLTYDAETSTLVLGLWVAGDLERFSLVEAELNDPAKLVSDIKILLAARS